MKPTSSFQEIERADYRTTFADGLADICLGGWLLAYGFLMETPAPWIGAVLAGLLIPIWRHLRERFAIPRLGFVCFGVQRRQLQKNRSFALRCAFVIVALLSVAALLLIRNRVEQQLPTPGWGALPLGVVVAVIITTLAFLFDFKRLLIHAILILSVFFCGHFAEVYPPHYISIAGATSLLFGVVVFMRFLHDYPNPTDD